MSEQTQAVVKAQSKTSVSPSPQGSTLQHTAVNAGYSLTEERNPSLNRHFEHDFSKVRIDHHVPATVQTKLTIGQPGDQFEREADNVADTVMRMSSSAGSTPQSIGSAPMEELRRQVASTGMDQDQALVSALSKKPGAKPDNYDEAAPKLGEAIMKTDAGKKINEWVARAGKDLWDHPASLAIVGTIAAGAIVGLYKTHQPLPVSLPEIPLDFIKPGLSVKITYEGQVDKPTKAMLTISFTPKKQEESRSIKNEKYRSETERMREEQEKLRERLKTPQERKEDEEFQRRWLLQHDPLMKGMQKVPGSGAGMTFGLTGTPAPSSMQLHMPEYRPNLQNKGFNLPKLHLKDEEDAAVQRKESSATPSATHTQGVPPIVHDVLHASGQPLDSSTRAFMEPRFNHDFSGVRVHTDARAAESARSISALAYTVGRDMVFGAGQYAPTTTVGKRLLAHELTHVVQQRFAASTSNFLKVGRINDLYEKTANNTATQVFLNEKLSSLIPETSPQIQCQNATPPQGGPASAQFSVNQAQYLQMANDAIQQMSGRLVTSNTLAESIRPILSTMLKKATWRDEKGVDHGGGSIQYPLPNSSYIILNLQLILNDQLKPPDAGEFSGKGDKDGTLVIQIRNNKTVDQLKERLFHEASHMMAWIINRLGSPSISSPHNPEVRGLTINRFNVQKNYIQKALERLAENINPKRKVAGQPIISKTDLQGTATWLLGEILVRVETEVFRLFSDVQKERASSAHSMVLIGTSPNTEVNLKTVDNYIFDFSRKFLPNDRANLTSEDKSNLVILAQVLDGFFQFEVRKRFSPSAYLSAPIPREQIQIPLPPLIPPVFRPLPLP